MSEKDYQNPNYFVIALVWFLGGTVHEHPNPKDAGNEDDGQNHREATKDHKVKVDSGFGFWIIWSHRFFKRGNLFHEFLKFHPG